MSSPTKVEAACLNTTGATISAAVTCFNWIGNSNLLIQSTGTLTGGVTGANVVGVLSSANPGVLTNAGTIQAAGTITSGTNAAIAGVLISSGAITFENTGLVSVNGTLDAGDVFNLVAGLANFGGSVATFTNTGIIEAVGDKINDDVTPQINGIYNAGVIGTLENSGSGLILSNSTMMGSSNTAILNAVGGTITTLNNSATIQGRTAIGNWGTIGGLTNSGTISGGYAGIFLGAATPSTGGRIATLANAASSTIEGSDVGILVGADAAIGTITNEGTIRGDVGILTPGAISVLTNDGLIETDEYMAISAIGSIGVLTNNRTILAESHAAGVVVAGTGVITSFFNAVDATINSTEGTAINVASGGSIGTLTNNGAVLGYEVAVQNAGSIGSISNGATGTIGGTSSYGVHIGIDNSGTITSLYNAGTIFGDTGIRTSGLIGALTNEGTIRTDDTTNAILVTIGGSITTLVNAAGARIYSGEGTAMEVSSEASIGTLTNHGSITGDKIGILVARNTSATELGTIGSLTNSGTIQGDTLGIQNAGTITSLNNSGTIFGTDGGVFNLGTQSTITELINSGHIIGQQDDGIATQGTIGTLTNLAGGTISGGQGAGVVVGFNTIVPNPTPLATVGLFTNNGLVNSTGEVGVLIYGVVGTLNNSGQIYGPSTGLSVRTGGSIGQLTNSGTINGASSSGLYVQGSIGTLTNSGTIMSEDGDGIGVRGVITQLSNTGTIIGDADGIDQRGTIGSLSNEGLITGGNYGIQNSGTLSALTNSGTIQSAVAINNSGSFGPITNSGLIAGSIVNASANTLTISGGTGSTFGTLTGVSGGIGVADRGSIQSTQSGLVFAAGNILLNDNIDATGQTVTNSGATVRLANNVGLTGAYSQTGGLLDLNGKTLTGTGNGTISGGTISAGLLSLTGSLLQIDGALNTSASVGAFSQFGGSIGGSGTTITSTAFTLNAGGTIGAVLAGTGDLSKGGASTLTLAGSNTYSGRTFLNGGVLAITNASALGTTAGDTNVNPGTTLQIGGGIAVGAETLNIGAQGAAGSDGALVVTGGDNSWAGTVIFGGGVTKIAVNGGSLTFSNLLQQVVAAPGTYSNLQLVGSGRLILTGDDSSSAAPIAGAGSVTGATLVVNGHFGASGSSLAIGGGGTLAGTGTFGGSVTVSDGTIAPGNSPGMLTIRGDLTLQSNAVLSFELGQAGTPGGALNDLLVVGGDLVLGGTLNVTQSTGGTYGVGVYRLIDYTGDLTNNGLALGSMPAGSVNIVQTAVANQVNLINTGGLTVNYWDGNGPKNNGVVNGGSGTWIAAITGPDFDNWTTANGQINGPWSAASFAIFQAVPGTVTVDTEVGAVTAAGMQFAVNGYVVTGGTLTLAPPSGPATIRVGDGTNAGSSYIATIASVLAGAGGIAKTDLGTLILSGNNTYSGPTNVEGGTLRLVGGQSIPDASAVTLSANAALELMSAETIGSLAGAGGTVSLGGTLTTGGNGANTTFAGSLVGAGGLTKTGSGAQTLTGTSNYTGLTTVAAGTLVVDGALTGSAVTVQNGATLSGAGSISQAVSVLSGGTLSGGQSGGLTMGSLTMGEGANMNVSLGAPGGSGVFNVNGDLTLAGSLNVSATAGFGIGIYRVANYSGTLTDNGFALGSIPTGYEGGIQTSIANQVNLFVDDPNTPISFWNGTTTSPTFTVEGGSGTWLATSETNWTNAYGFVSRPWNSGFAIFQGQAGTVTVSSANGQVSAMGMQFVETGYTVTGASILLTSSGSGPAIIRVGDGTAAGAATTATIAASLGGSVGLEKADLGTLVLTGANTYTGGTTISGGTLQLGDGGTMGTVLGDVVNNGVLAFNLFGETSFGGTVSGSGSIVQAGSGTLSLTGNNSFSGGTTISRGTLRLTGVQPLGTGGITLNTAGTLRASDTFAYGGGISLVRTGDAPSAAIEVDPQEVLTLSGVISGAYGFSKTGTGTLILTGSNTYTGLTTISAGTLQLGDGGTTGSISGDVLNNANLIFNRSDTYAFTGAITGTGFVTFTGGGTVLFSSPYQGPVAVDNATVRLQAGSTTASPFTVYADGILGGTATIGALTVNSGGMVAPGYSPGTLTVSGPVTFNSGAVYQVDVTPDLQHDLILASGAVTLSSGANVQVAAVPGRYPVQTTIPIITTTDTVTGTFGGVTSDYAFLDPFLTYDAQNVYLTLVYTNTDFTAYAQTVNQLNTAVGAQALGFGNPVFDAVVQLSQGAVPTALNQLSGEIYPSVNTVILQEAVYLREAVTGRLRQSEGAPGAAGGPATAALAQGLTPTLWAQGYGGWGNAFGNGNAASISSSVGGFFAGLDVGVTENVRAGIVAGFSQTQFDVDARNSSGSMDNYDIGLYAGGQFGAFALRGGVSYTWHDVSVGRSVLFPGFSGATDGGYTVGTTQVFGEAAYDFNIGSYAFEPFLGLAYLNVSGGSLSEGGFAANGAALSVNLEAQNTVYTTLGIRAATTFTVNGRALTPSVTLGWQHAFGDTTPSATMLFLGGSTPFNVQGVPIAEDTAVVGAGLSYALSDLATLQVNYTGQIASEASQNAFTAQFSLKF
ncbi:autotransporter domain-containing protein [Aquabacter cavernae]|uniref:autotransporter domain-containing protein n=1 Tax=Aquabacter cavernae TaxID=2496029 RepID=UPI0013DFF710|nr:autotransporter domain-containing protein [Aquabacter cavernae]